MGTHQTEHPVHKHPSHLLFHCSLVQSHLHRLHLTQPNGNLSSLAWADDLGQASAQHCLRASPDSNRAGSKALPHALNNQRGLGTPTLCVLYRLYNLHQAFYIHFTLILLILSMTIDFNNNNGLLFMLLGTNRNSKSLQRRGQRWY